MVFEFRVKREQISARSDLIILFVCLLIAIAAWFRVSFFNSKEFKAFALIQYVIPDSLKMINQVPQSIPLILEMESPEWFKLKNRLAQKPLEIILNDENEQYFSREFIIQQFRASYSEFEIKRLELLMEDDLYIQLTKSAFKKVPVHNNANVSFYPGYDFIDSIKIEPDSITVFGPETELDSINSWPTESLILEHIRENVSKLIKLESPKDNQIGLSHQYVEISANIVEFTEKELFIPISIITAPKGSEKYRIFPASAKVFAKAPVSKYNELVEKEIEIGVSIDKINNQNNLLTIEVIKIPDYVKHIKVYPKFVEVYKYEK
jgi:hypothetical protein